MFCVYVPVAGEDTTGALKLSCTWVKTCEGEDTRTRYCGRELKKGKLRDDLFTPASTTTTEAVIDVIAVRKSWPTFIIEAKNAYFHADEDEVVVCAPTKV